MTLFPLHNHTTSYLPLIACGELACNKGVVETIKPLPRTANLTDMLIKQIG
jgi:hypothetical protein